MDFRIEKRIGVRASADRVWQVLTDFDNWDRWNTVDADVRTALRLGAPVSMIERLPGHPDRPVLASLGDFQPYAQLLWHEKRGWLFRTVRYFEIEALAPESCIVAHGVRFAGLRGEGFHDKHRVAIRNAYDEIGEALKREIEAG